MKRHLSVNAFVALLLCLSFTFNIAGQTRGWGNSSSGQLGFSTTAEYFAAPQTVAALPDAMNADGGESHTVFLKADGTVAASGRNWDGELGTAVQTLTGTGNVFIGTAPRSSFAGKPLIQTPVGFGVRHYRENLQMLFSNVLTAGTTAYTALDPTSVNLNVPAGYMIHPNEPASNVATIAQTSGETEVCIKVNEYNRVEFPLLKILHAEGANWIDRTFSSDYTRRRVCARVDSPSSFVIAKTTPGDLSAKF